MNAADVYRAFRKELTAIQGRAMEAGAVNNPEMTDPERKRRLSYARKEHESILRIADSLHLDHDRMGVLDLDGLYALGEAMRNEGKVR